jgi:hypothetical protein
MCLVYRLSISSFALAGLAVFANGCHNASGASTTPRLAADASTEAAGSDGSVLIGDPFASLDSSIPRSTDASASLDSRVPFSADVAAQDGRQDDTPAIQDSSVSPPADTSSDSQTSSEWLDNAGVCRSNQIPSFTRTCPKTFQDAVTSGAPVAMTKSGWCGDVLVWISYATPSVGCGYDSTGSALIAQYYGGDVPDHCSRTSYSVSTPNWPASCIPTPVDAGPDAR